MKVAGIPFSETVLPFYHSTALQELAENLEIPAAVPILKISEQHVIWDSLAIMEYLAESYPEYKLWPEDNTLRSLARSAGAEMHSGFHALRSQFPMNCRLSGKVAPSAQTVKDLNRLAALWRKFYSPACMVNKEEGEFLCGHFSIVDAMFAPILFRVKGYGLTVSGEFDAWAMAMLKLPATQEWLHAAEAETWQIEQYDMVAKNE